MNTPPPIAVPPRRILVVFNPAAGRARRARFEHVMTALRAHGCVVTLKETTAPRHAESIARDSSAMDFDIIAAAGGDGTINEVVNGLVGKNMPVGLIPLGTANVLAREIGLRLTPKEIAHALAYEAAARHALESAHGPPLVPCLEDLDAHLIRRHSIVIRGQ